MRKQGFRQNMDENAFHIFHSSPANASERKECASFLSAADLGKVRCRPSLLDFGTVSVSGCCAKRGGRFTDVTSLGLQQKCEGIQGRKRLGSVHCCCVAVRRD